MRFQLRLVAALWVASLLVIGVFAYFQVTEERQRLTAELDRRAALVSESLKEVLEPALARGGNKAADRPADQEVQQAGPGSRGLRSRRAR